MLLIIHVTKNLSRGSGELDLAGANTLSLAKAVQFSDTIKAYG